MLMLIMKLSLVRIVMWRSILRIDMWRSILRFNMWMVDRSLVTAVSCNINVNQKGAFINDVTAAVVLNPSA